MRKSKHREAKQPAQDLLLENNRISEAEHLTTISHCTSEIKVKEDKGGNGRYRNGWSFEKDSSETRIVWWEEREAIVRNS